MPPKREEIICCLSNYIIKQGFLFACLFEVVEKRNQNEILGKILIIPTFVL